MDWRIDYSSLCVRVLCCGIPWAIERRQCRVAGWPLRYLTWFVFFSFCLISNGRRVLLLLNKEQAIWSATKMAAHRHRYLFPITNKSTCDGFYHWIFEAENLWQFAGYIEFPPFRFNEWDPPNVQRTKKCNSGNKTRRMACCRHKFLKHTERERAENGIGTAAVVPLWPMVGTAQRTHVYYYYFVINNAIRRRINCSIEPQPRAVFVENAFVRCTRNAFSSPHCHCTRVTCVFLFASGFWYSENKLERRINWNWYRWKSLWLNGVCCAGHASLVHSPASITSCCSFSFSW